MFNCVVAKPMASFLRLLAMAASAFLVGQGYANAATTLYVRSLNADPYSLPAQITYDTSAFAFTPSYLSYGNDLRVTVQGNAQSGSWDMQFIEPNKQPLAVGSYENAIDGEFYADAGQPIMSLAANSIGCLGVGRYDVREFALDVNGAVTRVAIDFQARCTGGETSLFGQLRYNSDVAIDTARRFPAFFTFPYVQDAALDTLYVSEARTVSETDVPVPVSITGGEMSINGQPFGSAAQAVVAGDTLRVRVMSPSLINRAAVATLQIGDMHVPFKVASPVGLQPQPNGETLAVVVAQPASGNLATKVYAASTFYRVGKFHPVDGPYLETYRDSNPFQDLFNIKLQAGGLNGGLISPGIYTGVTYRTGSEMWWMGEVNCGFADWLATVEVLDVAHDANNNFTRLAANFRAICAGVTTGTANAAVYGYVRFNSLLPIDYSIRLPQFFSFASVANVPTGLPVISNEVTVNGINVSVPISVSGGEYSIDGGPFTAVPGTLVAGQKLRLRLAASTQSNTATTMSVTVGERTATFSVGTIADASPQPTGAPLIVLRSHDPLTGSSRQTVLSDATFWNMRTDFMASPGTGVIQARNASDVPKYLNLYAGGAGQTPLVPGNFPNSSTSASDGLPVFSIDGSADLLLCSYGTKTQYVVHEVEFTATGYLSRLALDFKQVCGADMATPSAVYGYVRINSSVPIDYNIQLPVRFQFQAVIGATPGSLVQSGEVVVQGITVPVAVTALGGDLSIDGGTFFSAPQQVIAGQRVRVRVTAPATENGIVRLPVTIGEGSAEFVVTTPLGVNPQPGGNSLVVLISQGTEPVGAARTFVYSTANFARIIGQRQSNGAVNVSLWSPTDYYGPAWQIGVIEPNGTALVPGTFSSVPRLGSQSAAQAAMDATRQYSYCPDPGSRDFTVHEATYTAGEITSLAIDFVQYCTGSADPLYGYVRVNSSVPILQIADTSPTPFTFVPSQYGVGLDTWVESQAMVIAGINTIVNVTVAGGEYSIAGGAFTAAPGNYIPGQIIKLRVRSSSLPSTTTSARVTLGGVTGTLAVQTPSTYLLFTSASGPGSVTSAPSGIDCPATCAQFFNATTTVTLTGNPANGATLTGWTGCASITAANQCVVSMRSFISVTATFSASVPTAGAPALLSAIAGNGQARILFSPLPPSVQPVVGYLAVCNPGNIVVVSGGSPVTVMGLTNGTTYTCRIAAIRAAGTGALSDAVQVTPDTGLALTLVSVQSRKTHADAGAFDLPVDFTHPIAGLPTIEPRLPDGNGHLIVFQYNQNVASIGALAVQDAAGPFAGSATYAISGADVLVTLGGIADNSRITVSLSGVSGGTDSSTSLAFLAGDNNASGSVTAADILSVKARRGQRADTESFRFDINTSGTIDAADIFNVRTRTGTSLR